MRSVLSCWAHGSAVSLVLIFICCRLIIIAFEGKLDMTLLTYAPIGNLPEKVRLESAEAYLPWKTFQMLLKLKGKGERKVQVLADFIMGFWILVNSGGWRFDGDCIVKCKVPTLKVHDQTHHGHFVGSMEAHPCTRTPAERWFAMWEMEYLKKPQDKLYIATPAAFCAKSPVLLQYLKLLADTVMDSGVDLTTVAWATAEKNSQVPHYNMGMQALRKAFLDHGLEDAISDAGVCTPLPYSLNEKTLTPSKNHLCKVERLEHATCVNCFFSSTKKASTGEAVVKLGSMDVVKTGCAWDILLESLGTPLGDGKWKTVVKPVRVQKPTSVKMEPVSFQLWLRDVSTEFALPASRTVQEVQECSVLQEWFRHGSARPSHLLSSRVFEQLSARSSPRGSSSCRRDSPRGSHANPNHHLPDYSLCWCRTRKI